MISSSYHPSCCKHLYYSEEKKRAHKPRSARKTPKKPSPKVVHIHYHQESCAPTAPLLLQKGHITEKNQPKKEKFNFIKVIAQFAHSLLQSLADFFQPPDAIKEGEAAQSGKKWKEKRLVQYLIFFSSGFLIGSTVAAGLILGLQSSVKTVATVSAVGVVAKFAASIVDAINKAHELFKKIVKDLQEGWSDSEQAPASLEP